MNEDFGVTKKRRRVTDFDFVPRQARIDVNKYRPASQIGADRDGRSGPAPTIYDDTGVMAIAADDPAWNRLGMAGSIEDSSGNDYDDGSLDSNGGGYGNDPDNPGNYGEPPKDRWYRRLWNKIRSLNRTQWLVIGSVLLIIVAGATAYALTRPDKTKQPDPVKHEAKAEPAPPPPPPTSPLTGMDVSEEDAKRPVIGLMIENSPAARPQSGLQEAGVVYEAIAEYGITRFLALFQEANPKNLGPVRSARPYFVDWAKSFDASYGHVGGSPTALDKIRNEGIRDIDQFANSGYYRRISQRYAPHNVYTTMTQLRKLTASKGWTSSDFRPFERKKESKADKVTAQKIDIKISGPTYDVHYDYDAKTNSYLRTMGGAAHKDADSGKRIAPKVVIGLATKYGLMADGYHSTYVTTGSGAVKIFQDGTVIEGTWKREAGETYQFFDADGKPVKLNPGQTWITAVGSAGAVTYKGAPDSTPKPGQ